MLFGIVLFFFLCFVAFGLKWFFCFCIMGMCLICWGLFRVFARLSGFCLFRHVLACFGVWLHVLVCSCMCLACVWHVFGMCLACFFFGLFLTFCVGICCWFSFRHVFFFGIVGIIGTGGNGWYCWHFSVVGILNRGGER